MSDEKGVPRHGCRHTEETAPSVRDCKTGQSWDSQDAAMQGKAVRNERGSSHNRDISSKEVFGNPFLCAQFIRDCIDVPALKHIRPEDIEDVSERYHPYLGTEFESDSVKRIRILGIGGREEGQDGEPSFLISLIEHKSQVDYDVSMQLLRYMICIWTEYRREMEAKRRGCTGQKGFRYPMIIPVVYYEGKPEWTADMRLSDRIREIPGVGDWIPDFRYEVIRVHDYSEQELLERGDEMSLIMLINKIQDKADLERFLRIPSEELDRIVRDSPEHVVDVLVAVMESLCFKIAASAEDRKKCVQKVRAREMGYLFENMERINVMEMQQSVEEQRRKMEEQQQEMEEQQQEMEEQRRKMQEQRQEMEEQRRKIEEQQKKMEDQQQEIEDQQQEMEEQRRKIEEQQKKMEDQQQEIEDQQQEIENQQREIEDQQRKMEKEQKRADETEERLRIAEEKIRQLDGYAQNRYVPPK